MANVYLRVSASGMPKETLRSILINLHGTGKKPLLASIGGSWYVRFDDNAGATRAAVMAVIESLFVSCEPVAGLPGSKRLEWDRPAAQGRPSQPQRQSRPAQQGLPLDLADLLLGAPIMGSSLFEHPDVTAARVEYERARYGAATRYYDGSY